MIFKKVAHAYFSRKAKKMVEKSSFDGTLHRLEKPMNEWTVALLTTAGVHLKTQPPFLVDAGDHSVRIIPSDIQTNKLMITHTHYDTSDAEKDINVVFPIDILTDLASKGVIAKKARHFYGMMGYIPNTEPLLKESIPKIIAQLKLDQVDVLLLSPG